jgi:two-component system, OmpR family, response regulator QseB
MVPKESFGLAKAGQATLCMMRLLLVEDSARLSAALTSDFRGEGFAVDHAGDGPAALLQLEAHEYDVMILDLMLPRVSGLEVLAALRASPAPTRVLVLSARDQIEDRVAALNLGADDYLVKPFDLSELKARTLALMRRRYGETSGVLSIGELSLDTNARLATVRGSPVPLSAKEYAVLETLMRHRGKSFTRLALFEQLYDGLSEASDRVVEVLVCTLRAKLASAGVCALIETRRGFGYRVP